MERDTDAPLAVVVFNEPHFNERCAAKGATSEAACAELAGVDRRTLSRWRAGEFIASLDAALVTAKRLDTTVDDLWKLRECR